MRKLTTEEWAGLARRLNDGGCPVQVEDTFKVNPIGLALEQNPSPGNSVFALDNGWTGYMLDMFVTNELSRPIRISGFQIKTPWGGTVVSLLPRPTNPRQDYYRFPHSTLGFDQSVVINRFFSGTGRLNPGDVAQGLLLCVDETLIPDEYPEHGRTAVELSVFDGHGNRFASEFRLCVDRSATISREHRIKSKAASSLMHRKRKGAA